MTINLKHEMIVFWSTFLCVQLICILFDFFRALRKRTSFGTVFVAVQDIVFCILSFKIFFDTVYISNNGHLRWYIFVSAFLSAVIYFCSESAFALKIWTHILKFTDALLFPFVKLVKFIAGKLKNIIIWIKMKFAKAFGLIRSKIRCPFKQRHKDTKNKDLI